MEYQHIIFFISSGIQSSSSLVRMRPWNPSRYFWQLSVKWILVKLNSALSDRMFCLCSPSWCLKDRMPEINWFICLFGALLNDKSQMEIQICWSSINCAGATYWHILVIRRYSFSEEAGKEEFTLCEHLWMISLYVTTNCGNKVNYPRKTW